MNSIIGKFIDGGPGFTIVIFICLILVPALFAAAFINRANQENICR